MFQLNPFKFYASALASVAIFAASSIPAEAQTQRLSPTDFIKIRCNTNAAPSLTRWQGRVTTTGVGSERSRTLFKIEGFNIARCLKDENGDWVVTSRELTFYKDPQSEELLQHWLNPWTGEKVPVVHIANALVQQTISANLPLESVSNEQTSLVRIDVPLSYPNPLAGDARFLDYSPEPFYKAFESFTYVISRASLEAINSVDSIDNVQVSWTRVSPWLPWMRMRGTPGYLVFDAIVKKHAQGEEFPNDLRKYLEMANLQLYLDAPKCVVKTLPNVTSWSYFKTHFEAYLRGEAFPRPEPSTKASVECP